MSVRLKPQDVLIALKLAVQPERQWTFPELALALSMSASEVHAGVRRLDACRLRNRVLGRVDRAALHQFLVHGLAHVFPAEPTGEVRGMPTALSAAPMAGEFLVGPHEQMVWKRSDGPMRGRGIEPLYRSAPEAAAKDPALYELLALADSLRVGRARERAFAAQELERRLS